MGVGGTCEEVCRGKGIFKFADASILLLGGVGAWAEMTK